MRLPVSKITIFLFTTAVVLVCLYILGVIAILQSNSFGEQLLQLCMITAAVLLSFQGIFTLFWMLFGWENPEKVQQESRPTVLYQPELSFSLLVPARFESRVIARTIRALANLDYPDKLIEVLILCKIDDTKTIAKAEQAIRECGKKNMRVLELDLVESSKPSALNLGLEVARNEIVGVFDAEDEPNEHILDVVNSVFLTKNTDAVQGGVQLMNYNSKWYSPLNVLEYYFWYRSALYLFSKLRVVPLGGNTVFFKTKALRKAGGWEECLTEDAEIGLRFSMEGKRIRVLYDARITTAEESPASIRALLKQRTRWNQGFLQILVKREWMGFKSFKRRVFAGYFLLLAQLNALNFVLVFGSLLTFFIDLPVFATLVVLFPLYLLSLQLLTQLLGYYEFCKDFKQPFSLEICAKIVVGFIPYQVVLAFAAFRAIIRHLKNEENWEKTPHENLHRLVG